MGNAYIVDACRTPRGIGKVGKGALAHLHPSYLGSTVLAAMAERNNLNTAEVDDIIWGTSSQTGKQGGDLGRMAAIIAGESAIMYGVIRPVHKHGSVSSCLRRASICLSRTCQADS